VAFISSIGNGDFSARLKGVIIGFLSLGITVTACAMGGSYIEKKIDGDKNSGGGGTIGFFIGLFIVFPIVLAIVNKFL